MLNHYLFQKLKLIKKNELNYLIYNLNISRVIPHLKRRCEINEV